MITHEHVACATQLARGVQVQCPGSPRDDQSVRIRKVSRGGAPELGFEVRVGFTDVNMTRVLQVAGTARAQARSRGSVRTSVTGYRTDWNPPGRGKAEGFKRRYI